jgi:hypothetical protein
MTITENTEDKTEIAELKTHVSVLMAKIAAMENFEERLQKVEKACSCDAEKTPGVKATEIEVVDTSKDNTLQSLQEDEMLLHYRLVPSIYDASVFLFTDVLGNAASVYTFILLMMNEAIIFYVTLVVNSVSNSPYDDEVVAGFRWWRNNVGHSISNVDPLTDISLASRVCTLDQHTTLEVATFQAFTAQDIIQYLDDNDGFILCLLILFVWLVVLWSEVRQSIEFFLACFSVPKGETMQIKVYKAADDVTVKVLAASAPRHAWIAFLAAWRFGLAIFVCVAGARFLIYSELVEDLILNAVALVFILSIDEIFFDGLAPTRVKTLIKTVAPFEFPKWHRNHHGCGVASLSGVLWITTILCVIIFGVLPTERDSRLAALNALCPFPSNSHFSGSSFLSPNSPSNWENRGGASDEFAVVVDKVGMISWAKTNKPLLITKELNRDKNIGELVKANLNDANAFVNAPAESLVKARYKDSLRGEQSIDEYYKNSLPFQSMIMNSHPYRVPSNWTFWTDNTYENSKASGCIDIRRSDGAYPQPKLLPNSNGILVEQEAIVKGLAFDYLSDLIGYQVTDCSQVKVLCTWNPEESVTAFEVANAWCPSTCGCDRPDSVPTNGKIIYGCPGQCPFSPVYRKAIADAPCEDTHSGSPTWNSWINITQHYGRFRQTENNAAFINYVISSMKTQGCGVVTAFPWMCDEPGNLNSAYLHWKGLRYWCPISCRCNSLNEADCPSACNGTMAIPSSGVSIIPALKPGIPDQSIAGAFAPRR